MAFESIDLTKNRQKSDKADGRSMVFAYVDCEATGGDAEGAHIIEVACILVRKNRPQDPGGIIKTYQTMVYPGGETMGGMEELGNTHIHGISKKDVEGAPEWKQVREELYALIAQADYIVGHNIAKDLDYMNVEDRRLNEEFAWPKPIDTQELAKELIPELRVHGLGMVARALGVKLLQAHRAYDDTEACMHIHRKLCAYKAD